MKKPDCLRHEAFLAEVLRLRTKLDQKQKEKLWWQRFLESSGGTALVTVLLGGLLGQLITSSVQVKQQEREFQQAWIP